jgi:quinol monooxygenase YgiN
MLALVVRFNLRDEAAAVEFDALTEEAVAKIHEREPDTLVYATSVVTDDPLARIFYELYRNDEAFQAHETAEQRPTRPELPMTSSYIGFRRASWQRPGSTRPSACPASGVAYSSPPPEPAGPRRPGRSSSGIDLVSTRSTSTHDPP